MHQNLSDIGSGTLLNDREKKLLTRITRYVEGGHISAPSSNLKRLMWSYSCDSMHGRRKQLFSCLCLTF